MARQLKEAFEIDVRVNACIAENTHDYETVSVRLSAYAVEYLKGEFTLADHDKIQWYEPNELSSWRLAHADVPLVKYIEDWVIEDWVIND